MFMGKSTRTKWPWKLHEHSILHHTIFHTISIRTPSNGAIENCHRNSWITTVYSLKMVIFNTIPYYSILFHTIPYYSILFHENTWTYYFPCWFSIVPLFGSPSRSASQEQREALAEGQLLSTLKHPRLGSGVGMVSSNMAIESAWFFPVKMVIFHSMGFVVISWDFTVTQWDFRMIEWELMVIECVFLVI